MVQGTMPTAHVGGTSEVVSGRTLESVCGISDTRDTTA